ncbi:tetratricopeptide repeat protein [Bacillus salitolerans]|uniref:Tetratricopeptide repeat protein n=1 Tax=Bacillus salitolerans TaxID=1437434 RepID=A0ABW4LU00_9BACI
MEIGLIIKNVRKGKQLTQESLAYGICSVSHLSKIENGSKEVNEQTISLLTRKLDVDFKKIQKDIYSYKLKLNDMYKSIVYQDQESANQKYVAIKKEKDYLSTLGLDLLFTIIEFRYFLFINKKERFIISQKSLSRKSKKFPKYEKLLFNYFNAIYNMHIGDHSKAQSIFNSLVGEPFEHYGEFYYHISLTMSMTNNSGAAILYGIKALELFESYNNFTRKVHTQMNLAISYFKIGAFQESEHHYKLLLENAQRLGDYYIISQTTHNLSLLMKKKKNFDEAISLLKTSIKISREIGSSCLTSLAQLVETYIESNQPNNALEIIPEVIMLSQKENNKAKETKYKFKFKYLSLTTEEFANSVKSLDKLEKYLFFDDIIIYCSKLIDYYQEKEDYKSTIKYLEISNKTLKKQLSQSTGGL